MFDLLVHRDDSRSTSQARSAWSILVTRAWRGQVRPFTVGGGPKLRAAVAAVVRSNHVNDHERPDKEQDLLDSARPVRADTARWPFASRRTTSSFATRTMLTKTRPRNSLIPFVSRLELNDQPRGDSSNCRATLAAATRSDAGPRAKQLTRRTEPRHQPASTWTREDVRKRVSPLERIPPGLLTH